MRILQPFARHVIHSLIDPLDVSIASNYGKTQDRTSLGTIIKSATAKSRIDVFKYAFALLYPRSTKVDEFDIACDNAAQTDQIRKDGIIMQCLRCAVRHDDIRMLILLRPLALTTCNQWLSMIPSAAIYGSSRAITILIKWIPIDQRNDIGAFYDASSSAAHNGDLKIIKILEREYLLHHKWALNAAIQSIKTSTCKVKVRAVITYLIRTAPRNALILNHPDLCDIFYVGDFVTIKMIIPLVETYWQVIHWVNWCAERGKISQLRELLKWVQTKGFNRDNESVGSSAREAIFAAARANKIKTMRMIHKEFRPDITKLPDWVGMNARNLINTHLNA